MSGRPRIPEVDELMARPSVRTWLDGIAPKFRRQKASYLHRFLTWRKSNGLESNPDRMTAAVKDGLSWP